MCHNAFGICSNSLLIIAESIPIHNHMVLIDIYILFTS